MLGNLGKGDSSRRTWQKRLDKEKRRNQESQSDWSYLSVSCKVFLKLALINLLEKGGRIREHNKLSEAPRQDLSPS